MSKSVISRNKKIQWGQYCIRGTGIPIHILKSRHKAGDSIESLAEDYNLTIEQVTAAIHSFRRKDG